MPDDPKPNELPRLNTPPANSPEARNPDGSLKTIQLGSDGQPLTPPLAPSGTEPKKPEGEAPAKKPDETLAAGAEGEEGEAPKEGEESKKPEDAKAVPEKYEFKAPEGFKVSEEMVEKATPILKKYGVDQEGAQELFDAVASQMASIHTEAIDAYDSMQQDWRKEIAADPSLGNGKDGLSPQASKDIALAINALPKADQDNFKAAMNLTGAGNNPAFVKAMVHFGSMFREGKHVQGRNPSPLGQNRSGSAAQPTAAQALYPALPSSSNSGS